MALYPPAERGRRARRWMLVLTLAILTAANGRGHAVEAPGVELLVRFEPGVSAEARAASHAAAGARVLRHIAAIGYDVVQAPAQSLQTYRHNPFVVVAEPNLAGRIALAPADSCLSSSCNGQPGQWHLAMTNAPGAWDLVPGSTLTASQRLGLPAVTIAVLDTKIDRAHPDWIPAGGSSADSRQGGLLDLVNARDWIAPSNQNGSAAYHGTFVAGLAAAAAGNATSVAGIGFRATIMPLTVVDGAGATDAATLADAVIYAWQHGARVINLSLGIVGSSAAVHDAIRTVTAGSTSHAPSLVVAAAGNNTGSAPFYPGSHPEVMSVSGTDADDRPAPCSNHNANVSVSAPADRLIGLDRMPMRVMQAACGTSAAAPQVSGLAALLLAQNPARTPAQVRQLIESSTDDLGAQGRDEYYGFGRINAERALRGTAVRAGGISATVVTASGGSSTITATSSAARGVRAAQIVFDRPDASPITMLAADGAWGGTTEILRAQIQIPANLAPGAHPVWVRAFDGAAWGAAAVGVVAMDARAPSIGGAKATNSLRATGEPMRVTFSLGDDYAQRVHYGVQFFSQATGKLVFQDSRANVPTGAQEYRWLPGLEIPGGPFTIKIIAVDQVGNPSSTVVGAVVT